MARRRPRRRPRLVTLTSDIGAAYAAQMKGVLLQRLDASRVVDLVHDLPPHRVEEAAFVLKAVATTFPAGTVHCVVVDPGVGGARSPIAIECIEGSCLVGPDNGVLYPLALALGVKAAYRIDPGRLGRSARVGTTFDGRDLFAPAAAALADGLRPHRLGPRIRPKRRPLARPARTEQGAEGKVAHVDRFGNLITNVPSGWLPVESYGADVRVARAKCRRAVRVASYEALGPRTLGLLASSFGSLELAVREARADRKLGADVGTPVRFTWSRRRPARVRA